MSKTCETCIYRSFLFDDLTREELGVLSISRNEIAYKKGDVIFQEGDEVKNFIYLKEGLLKIYKTIDPRKEQIVGITKPKDIIGLLSAFSRSNHLFSISALEDSKICVIETELIRKLSSKNGRFAVTLLEKMSDINNQILSTHLSINLKNLRGRTAYIILLFAKEIYKDVKFDLPVSRKEIGELIEMRTENVIRILSELRYDGIIGIEGKRIEIKDMKRLEQIAEYG